MYMHVYMYNNNIIFLQKQDLPQLFQFIYRPIPDSLHTIKDKLNMEVQMKNVKMDGYSAIASRRYVVHLQYNVLWACMHEYAVGTWELVSTPQSPFNSQHRPPTFCVYIL